MDSGTIKKAAALVDEREGYIELIETLDTNHDFICSVNARRGFSAHGEYRSVMMDYNVPFHVVKGAVQNHYRERAQEIEAELVKLGVAVS
jgi:hypothetical protein